MSDAKLQGHTLKNCKVRQEDPKSPLVFDDTKNPWPL